MQQAIHRPKSNKQNRYKSLLDYASASVSIMLSCGKSCLSVLHFCANTGLHRRQRVANDLNRLQMCVAYMQQIGRMLAVKCKVYLQIIGVRPSVMREHSGKQIMLLRWYLQCLLT